MTDAERIKALTEYRLQQAREALAAAELNLSNSLNRSAVNRVLRNVLRGSRAARDTPAGDIAV